MSEWKEYNLGEIATKITSGGTPKSSESKYYDGDIPWLNTKEINFNRISKTERCITEEGLNNSSAKWIPKDSVIIAMYGATAAKVAYSLIDLTTNQACCNLIINNGIADSKFVYYYIQSSYEELLNLACGAAQQNLSLGVIADFPIPLPPLPTQRRIAAILFSLDDKIDLLHRENATLEQMAETLFRQWFVVEAKEEWEEGKLGDYFDVKTGKKDANFSIENGSFPFFTCSKQTLFAPSYSFEGSAILLAGNGDFNVKRYVGKFEAYQRTYVLIPYNEKYFNFLYIFIKYYLDELTGGHRGSVISFITKGMITDFPVFLPEKNIDNKLSVFDVIYKKVDANTAQIQTLIQTRDGLLPRLMSGDINLLKG